MSNYNTELSDNQEFLEFLNSEEFKVRFKKLDGLKLANIFRNAGLDKQSANIYYCSQNLLLDSNNRVKSISSCRTRLCPICDWRKSIKQHAIACKVLNKLCNFDTSTLQDLSGINFVFLTLTVENCVAEKLSATIDLLSTAWRRFIRTDLYKQNFLGSMRTLEITYNQKNNDYNPHLHILVHAKTDYYYKQNKNYIKHEVLKTYWKQALQVDYEPYVRIQPFRAANVKELNKSINEVTKYAVKSTDILKFCYGKAKEANILNTFFNSTMGRKLINYQGDLRKIKAVLNLDEDYKDNIDDTLNDIGYLYRFNFLLKKYEFVEEIAHE